MSLESFFAFEYAPGRMQTPAPATKRARRSSFVRGVVAMFALGLPGVAVVGATSIGTLRDLSPFVDSPLLLLLVSIVLPLVLLAFACLVGTALAPRVKLHSHVLYRFVGITQPPVLFAEEAISAVAVGVFLAFVVLVFDGVFTTVVPGLSSLVVPIAADPTVFSVVATAPLRFFYRCITEELLLGYGFTTLVVWVFWKAASGRGPSERVMWAAIAVSALVFGLAHLPALAMSSSLTPALVAEVVFRNGLVGIGVGWLYWQNSLESAMLGHVTFHVVVVVAVALLLAL